MAVEFDPAKRLATLEQRGLDMADCEDVFEGPTYTLEDKREDYGEQRFITIGFLGARMLVIVWTPRGSNRRIVSMRKANEREQEIYQDRFDQG